MANANSNGRTILVCGGAGYIGSHVVRNLTSSGFNVVVLDNQSTGHRVSVPVTVAYVEGSVGNAATLNDVFTRWQIDAVFHLCAFTLVGESVSEPLKYYENNVAGGVNLLSAMVRHRVPRIVFSSTAAVYGQPPRIPIDEECPIAPINPYGFSKSSFERILAESDHAYGLRWVALRYFNAAGAHPSGDIGEDHTPETHLIPLVLQRALPVDVRPVHARSPVRVFGNDYPTPDGTCLRDYVHVEDLAAAHRQAFDYLESGGKSIAVNLGNGNGFSVLEVIRVCEEITGQKLPYEFGDRRPGDPATLVASSALARKVLGWNPINSSLDNIVATAWNWHRSHPRGYGC